jgi:hypothetical protein
MAVTPDAERLRKLERLDRLLSEGKLTESTCMGLKRM